MKKNTRKTTLKRMLSVCMAAVLCLSLMMINVLAAGGLTNQSQVSVGDAEVFQFNADDGTFTKNSSGDYYGIPVSGHTFVAIKQGQWSIVWTPSALTDDQQTALKESIFSSSVQLSPGKGTMYFVSGQNSFPIAESNGSTYYVQDVNGTVYFLAKAGKISHFYYGDYAFDTEQPPEKPAPVSLTVTKAVAGQDKTAFSANAFTFAVKNSSNETVKTVTLPTAENQWSATVSDLPAGTYTVEETASASVPGYSLSTAVDYGADGSQSITLPAGGSDDVTVTNTYTKDTTPPEEPAPASLTINKILNGKNAADFTPGAFTFEIKNSDGTKVQTVTLPTADNKWTATVSDLPAGTYTVAETGLPVVAGYTLTSTTVSYGTEGSQSIALASGATAGVTVTNTYTPNNSDDHDHDRPSNPTTPEVDVPDSPVPLSPTPDSGTPGTDTETPVTEEVIPDNTVPLTPAPENIESVEIPENPTPLASKPATTTPKTQKAATETAIADQKVPLDAAPKTGDTSSLAVWTTVALLSGASLAVVLVGGRKQKDDAR